MPFLIFHGFGPQGGVGWGDGGQMPKGPNI